jgi:sporulation protein YlmC with PRC-barrel domain
VTPSDPIALVRQLLDLQIFDADDRCCGIVDDVELDGETDGPFRIQALLVGPGGYRARLPRWAMALVRIAAGDEVVRIPWAMVSNITSVVRLVQRAEDFGLARGEAKAGRLLPGVKAL